MLTLSLSLSAPSSSLWQWVCPFRGSTSPAREQLTWLVLLAGGWSSWLEAAPPALSTLHLLLRQQELYTQLPYGLGVACERTSLHFQTLEATRAEERRGPTQGAAFAEPQAQWPGSRWDGGGRHSLDTSATTRAACAWSVGAMGHGFYI